MTLKIGGGHNQSGRAQRPWNSGQGRAAQQRLDATVARANAQINEAIKVDGVQLLIWNKRRAGRVCSCSANTAAMPDTDGNGVWEDVTDDLDVSVGLRGNRNSVQLPMTGQEPARGVISGHPEAGQRNGSQAVSLRAGVSLDTEEDIRAFLHNEPAQSNPFPQPDHQGLHVEEGLDGHVYDTADEALAGFTDVEDGRGLLTSGAVNDMFDALLGTTSIPCTICFGTKYVDGYQLVNGKRMVFEGTHESLVMSGFARDPKQHPHRFEALSEDGYLEWPVSLPAFFLNALAIHVHDNLSPVDHLFEVRLYSAARSSFRVLTQAYLQSQQGNVMNGWLRVVPHAQAVEEGAQFSHVEITYQLAEWPYAQMPPVDETVAAEDGFEMIIVTNFELGGSVPMLHREAVFEDLKTRRMWKTETITSKQTAQNQIFGFDVSARMIQNTSALFRLKQSTNRFVMPRNYIGLETKQQILPTFPNKA